MKKVALALMVLTMVGAALSANVPTCPYCETNELVRELPSSYEEGFFCLHCSARCFDGTWCSYEEYMKLVDEKESARRKEFVTKRINNLIAKYGWTRRRAERVVNGYIYIGDTKEIVLEARGKPKDVNRTTTRYRVHEQWVYVGCYVYFDNGIVMAIQN